MADGFSSTFANNLLNALENVAPTAYSTVYLAMHVGAPGSAGTSNPSAVTTRASATFGAASAGSISITNTPSWTGSTSETISDISAWSASTGGTFLFSSALSSSKAIANGDTLQLSSLSVSITTAS